MKKLLLLLLLLPFMVEAQVPLPTKAVREWVNQAIGAPTFSSGTKGDLSINTVNKTLYEWQGGTTGTIQSRWKQITDQATIDFYCRAAIRGDKGDKGDTGATGVGVQGVQGIAGQSATVLIGTTTTLPSGSGATVTNTGTATNAVLNFGIPKGADGTGGSGGGLTAAQVLAMFPFTVVTTNGSDDTQSLQAAVNTADQTGKTVWGIGILKISAGIKLPSSFTRTIEIKGGFTIQVTNQNTFTVFYSDKPTSVAQAEGQYTQRWIKFSDIIINGNGQKQTGFNVYAAEGHISYSNIQCGDMLLGWNNVFQMRSYDWYCSAINCIEGMRITSGNNGEIPGGTYANSSSNGYNSYHFRYYAPSNGTTGITVTDASSVVLYSPTLEGFYFNIGISWNATAPTAEGAVIIDMHGEMGSIIDPTKPQQPGTAYILLRSGTNNHVIDKPKIKLGTLIAVESPGGYPQIMVSNIASGKLSGVNPSGTNVFKTVNGASWKFVNCDDPFTAANIPQMFQAGVTMRQGCGRGAGTNAWCNDDSINR